MNKPVSVKDVMTTSMVTFTADMDLLEASHSLVVHGISGAPVVDEHGFLVGILTERDPNSPVKYMTDLANSKIEALGGREKLKTLQEQEIGSAKKAMSKSNLVKTDWDSFVESIRC